MTSDELVVKWSALQHHKDRGFEPDSVHVTTVTLHVIPVLDSQEWLEYSPWFRVKICSRDDWPWSCSWSQYWLVKGDWKFDKNMFTWRSTVTLHVIPILDSQGWLEYAPWFRRYKVSSKNLVTWRSTVTLRVTPVLDCQGWLEYSFMIWE